jgi:uncharacterized protein
LLVAALCSPLLVQPSSAAEPANTTDDPRIHDIQGASRISPLAGQRVTDVPGVVTGVRT